MIDFICYFILPMIGSIFLFYAIFSSMRQIGIHNSGKPWQKTWIRRTVVGIYVAAALIVSYPGNGLLNLCMMLLIPVLGFLFYNDLKLYVVYDLIFVIAVFLTDMLVILCLNLFLQYGVLSFISSRSYLVTAVLIDRMMEFMVLKLIVFLIRKKNETEGKDSGAEGFSAGQLTTTVLLPISSIVILFSLITAIEILPTAEKMILLCVDLLILLGINIYFTNLFDAVNRSNRLKHELQLYRQQEKLQKEYYDNLEQKYQNTRKLVHDIRNHLQMMEHLYEEQQNQTGMQYAKDIHSMLNRLGMKYYTSSKMLNIVINDKVQQMEAKGITPEIMLSDCDFDFMRDVDITTLFGNLLDNAIESAEETDDKIVRLKAVTVHSFISITLENSCEKEPRIEKNGLHSQKKNHEGLGLKNAERIVNTYRGDIQYEWRKPYFVTRIMLDT